MTVAKPRKIAGGAIAKLRDRITEEGMTAAYEALLAVCRDPGATAQAKATAATTLFRAAGLLEKFEESPDDLDFDKMSAAEMMALIQRNNARLEEIIAEVEAELESAGSDEDEPSEPSPFD